MNNEQIDTEFNAFFEFPTADKTQVSSVSCKLFAKAIVDAVITSQAQQTESKPALKVHNGEICYQSTDDDQCYGMWCPVSYDTEHSYKEGTKFIAIPPAPEGDNTCNTI